MMRNMLGVQRVIGRQHFLEVAQHNSPPVYDDMTHNLTVHGLCGQSAARRGVDF
jgi:hypothetical protein